MTRTTGVRVLVIGVVLLLGVWAVRHYRFEETTLELPLSGEAADNPHYALEQLLGHLGVQVRKVATLEPPATHDVLYTDWHMRDAHGHGIEGLEPWVRAGGHLVTGVGNVWRAPFQHWSGVEPAQRPRDPDDNKAVPAASAAHVPPAHKTPPRKQPDECETVLERGGAATLSPSLCGPRGSSLFSHHPPVWSVADDQGLVALSVRVGSGWVTVLPPYTLNGNRELGRGDNAHILLGALGLRRGDVLYLYDESQPESLYHLLWRLAAAGLLLLGVAVLLLILRALPRFGTPIPAPLPRRRSLAEQIRATATFAWRTRHLQALRRAVVRALEESAGRQIAAYRMLDSRRRAEVLAGATGMDAAVLRAALNQDPTAPAEVQRTAIATLLIARRRFMQRLSHRGSP